MKGFYPEESKAFHLAMHAGDPASSRPTFYARFITRRQRREMAEKMTASYAAEEAGDEALAEKLFGEAMAMIVSRAVNVPEGFTVERVSEFLDYPECAELYQKAHEAVTVTKDELKKSASPSASDSNTSATSAAGVTGGDGK